MLVFAAVVVMWAGPCVRLRSGAGERCAAMLILAAGSALLGHWLDLYVMIVPGVVPVRSMPGLLEFGIALCIIAACAWVLRNSALQIGRTSSASADNSATFKA